MIGHPVQTRIKICGITNEGDALAAVAAGADAIGLVFYPPSPRAVSVDEAVRILSVLPPFVSSVGLFLDPEVAAVDEVLNVVPLSMLQFHGRESAAFCHSFKRPYLKALGLAGNRPLNADDYVDAAALLFDSHAPGEAGGTGKTFDWQRLPRTQRPVILAGGLTPQNVGEAVRQVRPYAVDVSSGVELAPGRKDPSLMKAFVEEVQRVSL